MERAMRFKYKHHQRSNAIGSLAMTIAMSIALVFFLCALAVKVRSYHLESGSGIAIMTLLTGLLVSTGLMFLLYTFIYIYSTSVKHYLYEYEIDRDTLKQRNLFGRVAFQAPLSDLSIENNHCDQQTPWYSPRCKSSVEMIIVHSERKRIIIKQGISNCDELRLGIVAAGWSADNTANVT